MIDNFFQGITPAYYAMLIRFVICVVVSWIIIDRLYYRKSKRRDFYFTFMLISISIFFLVFFMIFVLEDMKGKAGIGLGIGLFGIFSIMRYRTDTMPVREMTYLYDKIELISPDKREELIADLKKRTGLDITKVEVGAIDFLRDMTVLRVHYRSTDSGSNSVDKTIKLYKQDLQ